MRNRKQVVCIRCNKEKLHFGLQMCSACLRRTKRETKPSFYLGTCYSEMSRRVKTYDKLRPNYYRKIICLREEFINRFLNDKCFLKLYKNWQKNDFKRKYAPTIDRINNNVGYNLENLQFISHYENSTKDRKIAITLKNNLSVIQLDSCVKAAKFLKISQSYFNEVRLNEGYYNGWNIYES